jgi:ABC-type lipoprotein export system ATPase subunit
MSMLELEHVSKRYREGRRERLVLDDVTLHVEASELVAVYGARRSGRTTLLRVAAGLEPADGGAVRFAGAEIASTDAAVLGEGIGYLAKRLRASEEDGVLEQVTAALLARGLSVNIARERAHDALARAGAQQCAAATVRELSPGESVRVAIAKALALSPALLVADEPVAGVALSERDGILALLRNLAATGTAVLLSTGEADELAGAHRALTLGDGRLRGPTVPVEGNVVALRRRV